MDTTKQEGPYQEGLEDVVELALAVREQCCALLRASRPPGPAGPADAAAGTSADSNLWGLRSSTRGPLTEEETICSGQPPCQDAVMGAWASLTGAIAGLACLACQQQEGISEVQEGILEVREGISEVRKGILEVRAGMSEVKEGILQVQQDSLELKRQILEQKQQISELRRLFGDPEADSDKQLLREMATQLVNKLARKLDPDLTPYDARDLHMGDMAEMAEGPEGEEIYQYFITKYPKLRQGVISLCALGRPVAHPMLDPAVTEGELRRTIERQKARVHRVYGGEILSCLIELASDMQEPLFVSTKRPQGGL